MYYGMESLGQYTNYLRLFLGLGVGISASGLGGTFLSGVEHLFFSGLLPPPAFPLHNSLGSGSAADSFVSWLVQGTRQRL